MSVAEDGPYQKAVIEYVGEVCRCGGEKKSKHPFCAACYNSLPLDYRDGLYEFHIQRGMKYVQAFEVCVGYLRGVGRIASEDV